MTKPDKHGWLPIEGAPRDGAMIHLAVRNYMTGEVVVVPGCWMMPAGDPALENWWAATGVLVNGSELPHRIEHSAVTPLRWQPLPAPPENES